MKAERHGLGKAYLRCCANSLLMSPWVFSGVVFAPRCFQPNPLLPQGIELWPAIACLGFLAAWAPFHIGLGPPFDIYDENGPP